MADTNPAMTQLRFISLDFDREPHRSYDRSITPGDIQ
jgi:hypothetical protein